MYVDSSDSGGSVSGPAASILGRRKKSSDAGANTGAKPEQPPTSSEATKISKKNKKKDKKDKKNKIKSAEEIQQEQHRAESFKRTHPGVKNVPDRLDKSQFRGMVQKHGKGTQATQATQ